MGELWWAPRRRPQRPLRVVPVLRTGHGEVGADAAHGQCLGARDRLPRHRAARDPGHPEHRPHPGHPVTVAGSVTHTSRSIEVTRHGSPYHLSMAFPDLAAIGALLADPTRAAMLAELLDGHVLTAG